MRVARQKMPSVLAIRHCSTWAKRVVAHAYAYDDNSPMKSRELV
ncbi:MAG: hypothetical protein ACXVGB_11745 [Mycobacteriaceae bacterium]